jgi:hypothetical protein
MRDRNADSIWPIIYSFTQRAQPTGDLDWHLKVLYLFELLLGLPLAYTM